MRGMDRLFRDWALRGPRRHGAQLPAPKGSAWVEIPLVYTNKLRAILNIEKGTPGEQAFQQVFAAWKE
jgi:hypothetical protein